MDQTPTLFQDSASPNQPEKHKPTPHRVDRKIEVTMSKQACDTLDRICLRFQIEGNARASRSHLLRSIAHLLDHVDDELGNAILQAGMTARPPNGVEAVGSRVEFERRMANAIICASMRAGTIPITRQR